MRSRFLMLGACFLLVSQIAFAVPPGDKRTILTSGDKVYTIRYQLGQSTVLYFGLRPETVICGNKNYFNIEKIKDGITIQPLSSFSTNLTIISQGRRYLFFLTPAAGARPDGFIEVKWIPVNQARPIQTLAGQANEIVKEIGQKMKVSDLELTVSRLKIIEKGKRRLFEMELKNTGTKTVSTNSLEIVASNSGRPIERQVAVWEEDEVSAKKVIHGRLIISGEESKSLSFVVGYQGRSTKISLKGGGR